MAGATGLDILRQSMKTARAVAEEDQRGSVIDADQRTRTSHLAALSQAIEGEIIPRLLLAHRRVGPRSSGLGDRALTPDDVAAFADILLSGSVEDGIVRAELLVADGIRLDSLLIDLFGPAARRLGVYWDEDMRSFTDVTIALGRLQHILRHFTPALEAERAPAIPRNAFLVPAPGEQHTFGLFMVEMFLFRSGWHVDILPTFDPAEVRGYLRERPVDLIGISCSCERFLDNTRRALGVIRGLAGERVPLLAGGLLFNEMPSLCADVGADVTAASANEVVELAARLVPHPIGEDPRRRVN